MTDRENVIGLLRRTGYERMPIDMYMTPHVKEKFAKYCEETGYKWPVGAFVYVPGSPYKEKRTQDFWRQFYEYDFADGTSFDGYGVAHEPGSEACFHMTRMHHPLKDAETLEELERYPFPEVVSEPTENQLICVQETHDAGRFALGAMPCTVWETSWYVRSMETLMMDMVAEPELAEFLLDKVTENAVKSAVNFAKAGVDGILVGDDIGMQSSIMMSEELYREYIKPRLKKVIDAAREINPEVIVLYHSCGYVLPFIGDLIEAGVDVLDPVQPESMDFEEIYREYGDRLSFHGLLGTQTLMPFGTPEEIKAAVKKYLDMVGPKGGLMICPTHDLEPEVPVENIVAYIDACIHYKP